jgi:pantoate--beta-alanine ligase
MQMIRTISQMQKQARLWKREGRLVGFVPTMGFLHEGHVSLIRRARKSVGAAGAVVVSIYVNPTQFAPSEDLSKYPRDLERDTRLCREAGVDVLFVPSDDEMYRLEGGAHSVFVVEEKLSLGMEGASRTTHFRGVTTVVAKLFNITLPDVAVFGAKDFQQAAVVL